MESKKTKKADLENKRGTFLLLGLVISLGMVLIAFEWKTAPSEVSSLGTIEIQDIEEDFVPVTRREEIKPETPLPQPKFVEILNIVEDDADIVEELDIAPTDADDETFIEIAPVIKTEKEIEVEEDKIFVIVEEKPEFPGGDKALYAFINNNLEYPIIAQENGIQGRVYLRFVVDVDGSVKNAEVVRGADPALDKEALRVINSLPKFKPGKQRGRPVKVYYSSFINFVLQ